ncbi:MAG: DUF3253 domain-containing protein [Pseudomonadota bacterium]
MLADETIATEILRQVGSRGAGKSICPSEVARALASDWRPLMPRVRAVAGRLANAGKLAVTQQGIAVDPLGVRGPVRLSRPRKD